MLDSFPARSASSAIAQFRDASASPHYHQGEVGLLNSVDCVIFGFYGTELHVLLHRFLYDPFKGYWALLGGFVHPEENIDDAARNTVEPGILTRARGPRQSRQQGRADPKVIGGYTPACLEKTRALYSKAIKTLVPVSSCRAAEATKLLENIFRGVNIALVNELKMVYGAMGIDVWEVINAAKTKPFGFMAFYPGPGLGGHCIPIDPFYLTWKAREYGQHTRFIELAGEVNTAMPQFVTHRVADALNSRKKPVRDSRILLLGIAYKANVDDDRESPSYTLMDLLKRQGADISYYDPHVPIIRPTREHPHWAGVRSVKWKKAVIAGFDLVLVATAHKAVNYQELADWAQCIVETRNAMSGIKVEGGKVWKA